MKKMMITAYPNPTSGVLNITCEGCSASARRKIDVFDIEGRKVMEASLFAPKSTINLSRLGNGVYLVVHSMDGQVVRTHQVIVNH
jgi:zinc metalloprotease ZmpB